MQQPASIYLLKAPDLWRVQYWKDEMPAPDREDKMIEKTRRRLSMRYGGQYHEFDVTDPEFIRRYHVYEQAEFEQSHTVPLQNALSAYLCISLTPGYVGKQYKIAATIIEPPNA